MTTMQARATKPAISLICAAKRGTTTPGPNAQTTPVRKIISTATTDGAGTHPAETEVGTMADGVIGIVTIIMKMEKEIATESAMIKVIGIPREETASLAEAVAERCQAPVSYTHLTLPTKRIV